MNSVPDLMMPNSDVIRMTYDVSTREKVFALGQNKVHEFNQRTRKWRICGQGISAVKNVEWDFDLE